MKVCVISLDIQENPEVNRNLIKQQILAYPGSDLYVLPEYMTTGFPAPLEFAESMSGPTVQLLQYLSALLNVAICGSLLIQEDSFYFNRLLFVYNNKVAFYDKIHLFSPGNEHLNLKSGSKRVFVTFKNIKFLLQICYDVNFPVLTHCAPDVIVIVANWTRQTQVTFTLARARAIENQCFVVVSNRSGSNFSGSRCVDWSGNEKTGDVIQIEMDIEGMRREKEEWDRDVVRVEGIEDVTFNMD
ncbi:Omega-amidase [Hexamita inflata]|uniref:Omega-amidase n=1 Tax=Hexamita inflata TaxID=28002 RepID=A0AA86NUH7_9EUKA|nr:Omega-amidase [Hexamita inflata]